MNYIKFLLSCATSAMAIGGFAQVQPGWGVRVGYDLNIPGNLKAEDFSTPLYKLGSGVSAGAVYTLPLGFGMYFEPGVSLYYDAYRYKDIIVLESDLNGNVMNPKIGKAGFSVPLHWGYRIDWEGGFAVTFYTGPQLRYSFWGKCSDYGEENDMDGDFDKVFGQNGIMNRFDCSWDVGVGLPMGQWVVNVTGQFGLRDIYKGRATLRENRVNISLGYNF